VAGAVLVVSLAACGSSPAAAASGGTGTTTVTVGALSNGAAKEVARLVAAVLGLQPQLNNATWENLFVGIDSGRTDIGFSNITDTEQRKQKYDFASYRQDNLAFETKADSTWTFSGDPAVLDGLKVSVGRGTNQEKILLEWQAGRQAAGKGFDVVYYPDNNAVQLALSSGQIDAHFGPNPGVAYQVTQSRNTPSPKRSAGTFSGAGATLQGLIAATTKKDSGLAKPVADAINHLIQNGQYQQWLDAWNLADEAVPTSEVNPPGLPLDNT
jgi:polar amino acid transport system substrate-binding protein